MLAGSEGTGACGGLAAEHTELPKRGDSAGTGRSSCFPDSSLLGLGAAGCSARATGAALHSSSVQAVLSLVALGV